MFQEFPKMLYRGEANTIAQDAQHEKSLRDDGWHDFGRPPKAEEAGEKPVRRGRPPKAEEAGEKPVRRGRPPKAEE